jgi:hypothetical protein
MSRMKNLELAGAGRAQAVDAGATASTPCLSGSGLLDVSALDDRAISQLGPMQRSITGGKAPKFRSA